MSIVDKPLLSNLQATDKNVRG